MPGPDTLKAMSETEDNLARPRFPFVAALLCVGCIGAAARLSPRRHGGHGERREGKLVVLRDLRVSVVRFAVAGLVGAMGVFVFGAALRHWLGERRHNEIAT